MFDVGALELLVLVVIAVVLFGPEKLPEFARKAARLLRYVRTMAGNAQQQLSKELGPGFEDVDVRDLNPKAFIQKHLLDDVDPIVADVKSEFSPTKALTSEAATETNGHLTTNGLATNGQATNGQVHERVLTPFDPDAT